MSKPNSNKWRYGCDRPVLVTVPRGFSFRTIERPCGSTGPDGYAVQCETCARERPAPPPPDYGDDI